MKQPGTISMFAASILALSAGMANSQATFDTGNIPQPHLAAARAIAAGENSWRQLGLATCYPDDADAAQLSTEQPPATKIFDNLYYVGNNNVSPYALDTSAGIILFDAMDNAKEVDEFIIPGLRKVGLDPARLKVLIISHGHGDHFGGARYLKGKYGVKVYMSGPDWDMVEKQAKAQKPVTQRPIPANEQRLAPARDMVVKDGDTITLGDETIKLFITPGHTPGALSMLVLVKDHGQKRLLAYFGGAGNQNLTLDLHAQFDRSWGRLVQLAADAKVDGYFSNHPNYDGAIFKIEMLRSHPHNPNPYLIGTADTVRFIKEVKECNLNNIDIQRKLPDWTIRAVRDHQPAPKG